MMKINTANRILNSEIKFNRLVERLGIFGGILKEGGTR